MLNEVGVKITLVRSKDAFCLMGTMGMLSVFLAHASCGLQIVNDSTELSRRESRKAIFWTVTHASRHQAFNGHSDSNPFNFQHFNMSEIALYLEGQQQHTVRPWAYLEGAAAPSRRNFCSV